MTSISERQKVIGWLEEAMQKGARKKLACQIMGISIRSLQRWKPKGIPKVKEDQRPLALRPPPANKLSDAECSEIEKVCNESIYAQLPPSQIVPKLADRGIYLASESSFYRVLKKAGQINHRGRSRRQSRRNKPKEYIAYGPNEVWTWDITYLPKTVKGQYYYLYMIQDVYSRYGVAWEVHEVESGESAAELVEKAVFKEKCHFNRPILHSDNGSVMRSQTMLSKLYDLGITPSRSRPGVSNDNAYIESFFKTLKYCSQWPTNGFESIEEARDWVAQFMKWYNDEHQHSKIRFVTPSQRHRGEDKLILEARQEVYAKAKNKHPERWAGAERNWSPIGPVSLNPNKQLLDKTA